MKPNAPQAPGQDVVTLSDLAPRRRITGGSGRRVFGADAPIQAAEGEAMAGTKKGTNDLPSRTTSVKGGSTKLATNDNLTLVRIA